MKQRVAIIGASADRSKYSNKAIRAYLMKGWEVIPVNPRGGEIEGLPVARNLSEVPGPLDLVTIYLPPPLGIKVLPEIAAAKPARFIVNPGAESPELIEQARLLGIPIELSCSIIEIGLSPAMFN